MSEVDRNKIENFDINTLFDCYKKFLNCKENIFKVNINDENNVLRLQNSFTEIFKEVVLKGNKLNLSKMNIENEIIYQIKEFIEREDDEEYQYQFGIAYPLISINDENDIDNNYNIEFIKEASLNPYKKIFIALCIYPIRNYNNEILIDPEPISNKTVTEKIKNLLKKHLQQINNKEAIDKTSLFEILLLKISEIFKENEFANNLIKGFNIGLNLSYIPIGILFTLLIEYFRKKELKKFIIENVAVAVSKLMEISDKHEEISYLIRYKDENATKAILRDLEYFQKNKSIGVRNKLSILVNFSKNSRKEEKEEIILVPTKNKLTPSQQKAFDRILKQKITLIEGPPGTGKSVLITGICASYFCADKSIIVSSTNNKAVDSVYEKLKEFDEIYTNKYIKSKFYLKGYIRLGAKHYYYNFLNEEVEEFLKSIERAKKENNSIIDEIKSELNDLNKLFKLAVIKEHFVNEHYNIFNTDFEYIRDNNNELKRLINSLYKVNNFIFKIPLIGNITFRFYFQKIIENFEKLKIKYNKEGLINKSKIWKIKDLVRYLNLLEKYITNLEKLNNDMKEYDNLLYKYKSKYSISTNDDTESEIINELKKIYLVRKKENLFWKLATDQNFLDKLKALHETKDDNNLYMYEDIFFKFAPIILTTALSAPNYLKSKTNSVDLVIVDEAAQTLFLYAFPLFLRAKKFVVIGDKNQLEPVLPSYFDTLKTELENDLEKLPKHLLPDKSAFHTIEYIENNTLKIEPKDRRLLEHFRCAPSIIEFCNDLIDYGLTIKSNNFTYEFEQPLSEDLQELFSYNIVLININGEAKGSGSKYNQEEAQFIVNFIKNLSNHLKSIKDIAIITPYRRQEEIINKELKKLNLTEITVGTVHKLQGDEKDIIILSIVATKGEDFKSKFFNNKNLINVAVSRAKKHLIVVGNENSLKSLQDKYIIKKLYNHILNHGKVFPPPSNLISPL